MQSTIQSRRGFVALALAAVLVGCSGAGGTPAAPPDSLWQGQSYDGQYEFVAEPASALVDTPVSLRLSGLRAGQPVTLRAEMTDSSGQAYAAWATFTADDQGVVDPARQAPLYGTYAIADAMGLIWSMAPAASPAGAAAEAADPLGPVTISLTAEAQGQVLAQAQLERLFRLDEAQVVRQPIEQAGLVGTLYAPAAAGAYPAVIWLGGSEGGLREGTASLLAAHGYAALALAYFGVDPLPGELVEIPLEYFASAVDWLKAQPSVDPDRIALLGGSKGAELALLLAATYPESFRAVVAYKPSSVVWVGMPANPADSIRNPRSSWSRDGQPLPFMNVAITFDTFKLMLGRDAALRPSYERALADEDAVAPALIPVENIQGPVLLISGSDDQMWPSTPMGDRVIERLRLKGHAYPDEHLAYEGAGHEIPVFYWPMWGSTKSGHLLKGGSPQANALAGADAWPKVLAFLEEHLAP